MNQQEINTYAPVHSDEPSVNSWVKLVRGPILVSVLISAFTFVGTILLYRHLPVEEAGVLTLILAIMQIGLMLGALGQPTLIQRLYSYTAEHEFDWLRDLINTNLLALPVLFLLAVLAFSVYGLSIEYSLLIVGMSLIQLTILTESRILNASRRYIWASILQRLPNGLLFLPALALIIFGFESEIEFTLGIFTLANIFVSIVGIIMLSVARKRGPRRVSWQERRSGLIFLFTQTSYSLPEQGVVALGGGLLASSQLATYGAMSPILKPFELLTDVLRSIFTTELIRLRSRKQRRLVLGLWIIGLTSTLLAIAAGPFLVDWLYSGLYTGGEVLIPWLAASGLFRLLEVFPRSHIIGQSDQSTLRRFTLWQYISGVLLLSGGLVLIRKNGVVGMVGTMAGIQVARFLISELFHRREPRKAEQA